MHLPIEKIITVLGQMENSCLDHHGILGNNFFHLTIERSNELPLGQVK